MPCPSGGPERPGKVFRNSAASQNAPRAARSGRQERARGPQIGSVEALGERFVYGSEYRARRRLLAPAGEMSRQGSRGAKLERPGMLAPSEIEGTPERGFDRVRGRALRGQQLAPEPPQLRRMPLTERRLDQRAPLLDGREAIGGPSELQRSLGLPEQQRGDVGPDADASQIVECLLEIGNGLGRLPLPES